MRTNAQPCVAESISDPGSSSLPLRRSPERARVEPSRFAEFWALYPRKIARAAALKVWIRAKLDQNAEPIIAAIQIQRDEFLQREPQFVPHASVWLNGERWKDEIDRNPRRPGRPPTRDDRNAEVLMNLVRKEAAE